MKRIIAITLLLCLLLSFAASALAQTRPLRFLVNDNGEAAAWLKEHYPEIPSQNLHSDYDYSPGEYDSLTDRLLGELESGDGPDLYLLDSNAYDLARVLGSRACGGLERQRGYPQGRFAAVRAVSVNEYEFPGDDTPIIKGSAVKALEGDAAAEQSIMDLMEAVDAYIPQPERPVDQPFLMPVEDVFSISGRGTVATGRIGRGIVKKMEEVEIIGIRDTQKTSVTDIEMFRKLLDEGQAGDNVGLLLRGVKKEDIERGQVIIKPGTVKPHKNFKAEVYVLTKEEGGRHTPFFNNYRPQFYFRTTDVTGCCTLPEGVEMVMPGDNVNLEVQLITPIAMEKAMRFAIREGGRTVGAGRISEILD